MPVNSPLAIAWASERRKSWVKTPGRSHPLLVVPAGHRENERRGGGGLRHHDGGLALQVLHCRGRDVDVLALGVELDRAADDHMLVDLEAAQRRHQYVGL